jgi:hypothetical protein
MWLIEVARHEPLHETAIVAEPVMAVELGPALVGVEGVRERVTPLFEALPDRQRRTLEDDAGDPLGGLRRQQEDHLGSLGQ